ncbi:DoxX family protein [Micromonospora sp. I033]
MPLLVLLIALVGLRGLGALGVRRFARRPAAAAHALALMLVMTASAHFVPAGVTVMPTHDDLARMVPPAVPFPSAMVYLTGVLELLGAVGLVLPATRRAAGYCLALLFVVLLPANIYAATAAVPLAGEPASPLWQRVPEQILYIGVALWATRGAEALPLPPAARSRAVTEARG